MVNIQKLKPAWHDYRTDIPQWVASGIGQVAVEWSVLERELEELIRLLMDANIQAVRIVADRSNARNRVSIAANLIEAHILQNKLSSSDLSQFIKLEKRINA